MIKTDAQLERTRAMLEGFLAQAEAQRHDTALPEAMRSAIVQSTLGMVEKLRAEITEFEQLKQGDVRLPRITSITELVAHMAKFRIALGMSQEQLAGTVGVSRQTINKYEEQEYQTAPIDLITRVMKALGILPDIAVAHQTLSVNQPNRRIVPRVATKSHKPTI